MSGWFALASSLGIIGGLGPATTARFYGDIVGYFRQKHRSSPSITMDNVAFPLYLEEDMIKKSKNGKELLPYLKESIRRLNLAGVDAIVLPCNTAHMFIGELRCLSRLPIISIVEETAVFAKNAGCKTVGLLSSALTLNSRLYQNHFLDKGISIVIPDRTHQQVVSGFILGLLNGQKGDAGKIREIAGIMKDEGAEAVILGCTDLQLGLEKSDLSVPIIDSYEVLLQKAISVLEKKTFLKQ
jgi:aspartate racemase